MLENILPRPREKLLDLGCGTGEFVLKAGTRFPESEFIGLDISDEEIMRAESTKPQFKSINFVVGDAHNLPFPKETFSTVTSISSWHRFNDPERALWEAKKVLKPYGRLLILDRLRESRWNRFLERSVKLFDPFDAAQGKPNHILFLPESFLERMLRQNGFARLSIVPSGTMTLFSAMKM